ncbi:MAG: 50S ribosomal protein L16 [Nitrospiraceae bacterium]|nr:50S ribosomal protein L16 [Nitrospiraceae bacterium]
MLMPERVKHRKQFRGRMRGKAKGGTTVAFGDYGIQVLEPAWITARQIEASRLVLIQSVRKTGKLWIRLFPDKPITKKPAETRMGSGKGDVDHWVAVVKPGKVIFEISGVSKELAKHLAKQVGFKLPIKVRLVEREEVV